MVIYVNMYLVLIISGAVLVYSAVFVYILYLKFYVFRMQQIGRIDDVSANRVVGIPGMGITTRTN